MPTAAELQAQIDQYQSWIDNSDWMNAGQRSTILPQYESTLANLQSQLDALSAPTTPNTTSTGVEAYDPNRSWSEATSTRDAIPGDSPLSWSEYNSYSVTPMADINSTSWRANYDTESVTTELQRAQQLYALRLDQLAESPSSRTAQSRLAAAEADLAVAQQNYNLVVTPSGAEALGQVMSNPVAMVTQAGSPTFSADAVNNGLIAAGTGQAGAAPQAGLTTGSAATVGSAAQAGLTTAGSAAQAGLTTAPSAVTAALNQAGYVSAGDATQANYQAAQGYTTGPAATANAPAYIPAATYQAQNVSGAMDDMLSLHGSDFATAELDPRATVQGQLEQLMQQFEGGGTPPWASGAMREAMAVMQKRGLGASSMAGMAVVQAAMESAFPIASQDAQHYLQMQMQNLANEQQSLIFSTQLRANALLSDQAAQNAALQFNAASENQTNQFFAGLQESIARFNADQINSVMMFNVAQQNATAQFNAGQYNQMQMFNASEDNAMRLANAQMQNEVNMFNTGEANRVGMFNAGEQNQINMFNAGQANQLAQFNVGQQNEMAQFNASEANRIAMFNAGEVNQVNMFNVGQINSMEQLNVAQANAIAQFNAQLQSQREQFNAQNSLVVAQANAQWRQNIALTEFQAEHESNMQAAQLATGLTAAGLDYLWQTERDLMSYAFTSSENALDRRVSLITADMAAEISRLELEAEEDAARGEMWGSIVGSIAGALF